jgi:hypothetical protein
VQEEEFALKAENLHMLSNDASELIAKYLRHLHRASGSSPRE